MWHTPRVKYKFEKRRSMNPQIDEIDEMLLISNVLDELDELHDLVQNSPSDKKIRKQYNRFMSAYFSLPGEVTNSTQSSCDSYVNWWSTPKQDFASKEYHRLYTNLRNALVSSITEANAKIERQQKEDQMIFRNLQISIDSSIGPLHQTEIPNFEEDTEHVKPFNKANYMYKSISTIQGKNNCRLPPIDFLFRPSTYSLFSHILFNSNGYANTCSLHILNEAIFHIVTGTPGIGKSVLRMPLIALTMTLGVNEVKTARKGEPSFIFRNRNKINDNTKQIPCDYDEESLQREKLDPIGQATITINRGDDTVVHIERDTFCYTYDVFMCPPTSENKVYDPNTKYKSSRRIGKLIIPSIHHFPHFFKLFVNHNNQVENRLRGTTWHIVDDYNLRSTNIPDCEHVVLLTSPVEKRWEKINLPDHRIAPVFMYNVPTLLFPEMIHMFNAIPCPYNFNTDKYSLMMRSQLSVHYHGMILRHVFDPHTVIRENSLTNGTPAKLNYRYTHASSPQFDPMNWFTQYATQEASQIVPDRTAEGNKEAYLSTVEKGLVLKNVRPIESLTFIPPSVLFPKTTASLPQTMKTSLIVGTINQDDATGYHPQWDFLFQCCLDKEALTALELSIEMDEQSDADEDFVAGKHRPNWARFQVVTTHLVPDLPRKAGFDSMLLMFRFERDSPDLHSLGVFFLKGRTGSNYDMSDEGVNLMKRWCYDLATQYRLKRVQIFPAFIVTDLRGYSSFQLRRIQKLESFIAVQNRFIGQFEAKGGVDVGTIGLPAMTASAAPVLARFIDLPVNRNPHAVRCAFCGSLVVKNFPNHVCGQMKYRIPSIDITYELIDDLARSNDPELYLTEEHVPFEQHPLSKQKKVGSGLQPCGQSSSHQEDYVQVTCTSEIPDMPDVYRLPCCRHSIKNRILSTRNQFPSEDAHAMSRLLSDQSEVIETHSLWAQRRKLSYVQDGSWGYRPIQLSEQPFESLEYDEPSVDITDPKHQRQFMFPAGANGRRDRVSVRLEEGTDPLRSKRIEYESFWQSLNRKEHPIGMDVTLQIDENKQIEMMKTSGDETMKSQLICILAKGLLLRSRLSLQNGDVEAAILFFVRSKQLVELNDTAAVECELIHALGRDSEDNSRVFDNLEAVAVNARNCFGATWEQWNQKRRGLPLVLSPSFHRLQFSLKRVQDCVTLLRWYLGMLGGVHIVDMQQTNGSRRAMTTNALLQVLKEGFTLQLQIAWDAGDMDEVSRLLRELTYINRMEGIMKDTPMMLPLKSQTKQIEELDIGVATEAIGNVLNTAHSYYEHWRAFVQEHQQTLSSEPRSSKNHERTVSRNEVRMSVQLLVDWISAIVEVFPQKLQETGNDHMINALFEMICELSSLETATSNLDANVVMICKQKEEMGLFERANLTFHEGVRKRTTGNDEIDLGSQDSRSKGETRASIDRSLPMTLSSSLDFSNRTTIDLQTFRERFGQQFVDDVEGDGNCWLYAVLEQLTDEDLARAGIEIPNDLSEDQRRRFFVDHIRPRLVEDHDFPSLSKIFERPIAYYYPNVVQPQVYERSGRRINIGFCGECRFVSLRHVSRDKLRQKAVERKAKEQAEEEEQLRRLVVEGERRQNREEEERRKDSKRRK
ncbi:hypothetical protein BLNAU_17580 [Blattamonas nauphoetae]|uniref:OTU domain-containing protein n=1 Tax=Blattamonas nauphoetae TaxID=2049346 RepID=A0ABQ9X6X7_9EUKA|nr:hypothetical protein BLNAU_17580 [Blattamonas nauphoetae]